MRKFIILKITQIVAAMANIIQNSALWKILSKTVTFIVIHKNFPLIKHILAFLLLIRAVIYFFSSLPYVEYHIILLIGRGFYLLFAILLQTNFKWKNTLLKVIYAYFLNKKIELWSLEDKEKLDQIFIRIWDCEIKRYVLITTWLHSWLLFFYLWKNLS